MMRGYVLLCTQATQEYVRKLEADNHSLLYANRKLESDRDALLEASKDVLTSGALSTRLDPLERDKLKQAIRKAESHE